MTGTWGYTESTNTVEVTGGTSGTPATFADFVTADRAGTDTSLLSAGSPANDLALTYAVRPVEDLAIKVKCVVANKTAEADYIFITGTDWRGDAQTEAIDVTAGDGSYETTKYWASITTLDCSDNAAGGGTVWADGDLTVTQDVWGVIWDYGNDQYQISGNLDIGNGSTATYLATEGESITFAPGFHPVTKSNAEFRLGDLVGDWGVKGSYLSLDRNAGTDVNLTASGSTMKVYASMITDKTNDGGWYFWNGVVDFRNTILNSLASGKWRTYAFLSASSSLKKAFFTGFLRLMPLINTIENVHGHNTADGFYSYDPVTITEPLVTSFTSDITAYDDPVTVVNPETSISTPQILHADGSILEKFTINIHVVDKDGVALQSVTVLLEDDADVDIFSVATDASGDIAEQTITARSWSTTSETLDNNNPFKFTLSKAGYETLTLENITVDGPIDWHLELQSQKQPPAPWQEGMM